MTFDPSVTGRSGRRIVAAEPVLPAPSIEERVSAAKAKVAKATTVAALRQSLAETLDLVAEISPRDDTTGT